jgi:UPF0755 protein
VKDMLTEGPLGSPGSEPHEVYRSTRGRQRPPRRTALAFAIMLSLFAALVIAAVLLVPSLFRGGSSEGREDFPGPGSGSVTVEIREGQTGGDIGDALVEAGVVASRAAFVEAFTDNAAAVGIQAGAYDLRRGMRAVDAVAALLDPANRAEVKLTVVEGLRASQVYERIASVMGIPLPDIEAAAADPAVIGLPAEAGGNPEGWLAAATYTLGRDATAPEVLSQMVAQTVQILEENGVPPERRQEVLIKASIVEKEVNRPEDYGKVARVIENRLQPGSATNGTLGMDSTLAYGLGKSGLQLTRSELASDHAYNTRVHPGLPPGPIGSPGRAAIEAVVNPPQGDWLYFVTVNPDTGETRFTGDYQEHLANQELYRQWLAEHPGEEGATE